MKLILLFVTLIAIGCSSNATLEEESPPAELVLLVDVSSHSNSGVYYDSGNDSISNASWILYVADVREVLVGKFVPKTIQFAKAQSFLYENQSISDWYVHLRLFDDYGKNVPFPHKYFVLDSIFKEDANLDDWLRSLRSPPNE